MTTLHMETDNVRALASQLKQVAEDIRIQAQSLNGSTQDISWMGPSRDEFVNEIGGLVRQLDGQAEAGTVLAQRVESEVVEWEQAAASLGTGGGSLLIGGGFSGGGSGGGGGGSWGLSTAGVTGSFSLFSWMYSHSETMGADIESNKRMLAGIELQAYKGYLKGDLTLQEALDFVEKDPFEKKIDKSVTFYNATDQIEGAFIDGKLEGQYGTLEGKLLSADGTLSRSVEYKDGAFQANAELSGGAYLGKVSYDASVAGVAVAATGCLGAEAGAKGTAFFDQKKGEVGAKAEAEAFVGGKAEGSISKEVAGVTGKATGSVSYGLGATAKADVGFTQGHVRAEFELGATIGLGADVGFSVDLDVGKAANTISDVGKNAANWLFGGR